MTNLTLFWTFQVKTHYEPFAGQKAPATNPSKKQDVTTNGEIRIPRTQTPINDIEKKKFSNKKDFIMTKQIALTLDSVNLQNEIADTHGQIFFYTST